MVERVKIGVSGRPLSVLDVTGNTDALSCLFDANYRPLRGAIVKGVISVPQFTTGTVMLGVTLTNPPFFMALVYSGLSYNGVTRTETLWGDYSHDNFNVTIRSGHYGRSYTNRLEFYPVATNSSALFYYAALRNQLG